MTHNIDYSSISSLSNICFFLLLYAVWSKCLPNSLPHFQKHLKMIWPVFTRPTRRSVHPNWTTWTSSFALQIVQTSALSAVRPLGMFLRMYLALLPPDVDWTGRWKRGRCYKRLGGLHPFYQMFLLNMGFLLHEFTLESCWQHLWDPLHPESLDHVAFTARLMLWSSRHSV